MAGSPKKRERKENAKSFFDLENAIDIICARVRIGSLYDFCKEFNLHYGSVQEWIEVDEARRERYKQAMDVREHHGKDLVVRELLDHLKIDITQAFKADGSFKALEDIPDCVRRYIASMEVEELYDGAGKDKIEIGVVRKLKFYDKMKAIELLAKHLKMLTDKTEHTVDDALHDLLAQSYHNVPPQAPPNV
jgi:hypothetical protein